MFSFRYLLLQHGYALLGAYTLAAAMGSPIPVDPMLLVMGAMVGSREYSFWLSFLVALAATVAGDQMWYQIGRMKGSSVLGTLCKLALEPDTCVQKTESTFAKQGAGALLFIKFLPGLSIVSMALAGITRMPRWRFTVLDTLGSALWLGSYLLLGRIFYRQVDALIIWLGLFGRRAGLVVLSLLAIYIAVKYIQRRLFIRKLRINRVSPQEVRDLLENGGPITIVDLRDPGAVKLNGMKIAGALVLRPDELHARAHEIPHDHDIILYCT